jgi:hypothetical protein
MTGEWARVEAAKEDKEDKDRGGREKMRRGEKNKE